jgi:hypothetical protein
MLIGRDYRKRKSQLAAKAVYRYIAVWLLVYVCVTYGGVGQAVALGVIAIDIMNGLAGTALVLLMEGQSHENWKHQLTNRFFYGLFWERLKDGERELDIEELFREAREKALADIKSTDSQIGWVQYGFFDEMWWHWVGGVMHFFGLLLSDLVYYGSAFWLAGYRP